MSYKNLTSRIDQIVDAINNKPEICISERKIKKKLPSIKLSLGKTSDFKDYVEAKFLDRFSAYFDDKMLLNIKQQKPKTNFMRQTRHSMLNYPIIKHQSIQQKCENLLNLRIKKLDNFQNNVQRSKSVKETTTKFTRIPLQQIEESNKTATPIKRRQKSKSVLQSMHQKSKSEFQSKSKQQIIRFRIQKPKTKIRNFREVKKQQQQKITGWNMEQLDTFQ